MTIQWGFVPLRWQSWGWQTVVVLHHYSCLYCTSFGNKSWIFALHTIKTTCFTCTAWTLLRHQKEKEASKREKKKTLPSKLILDNEENIQEKPAVTLHFYLHTDTNGKKGRVSSPRLLTCRYTGGKTGFHSTAYAITCTWGWKFILLASLMPCKPHLDREREKSLDNSTVLGID